MQIEALTHQSRALLPDARPEPLRRRKVRSRGTQARVGSVPETTASAPPLSRKLATSVQQAWHRPATRREEPDLRRPVPTCERGRAQRTSRVHRGPLLGGPDQVDDDQTKPDRHPANPGAAARPDTRREIQQTPACGRRTPPAKQHAEGDRRVRRRRTQCERPDQLRDGIAPQLRQ